MYHISYGVGFCVLLVLLFRAMRRPLAGERVYSTVPALLFLIGSNFGNWRPSSLSLLFKITWDRETGGVLLTTRVCKETLGISPRPVFYEELDFLGLEDQGWKYPKTEAPIMWAINKQYWYRGTLLFEAKGANIYEKPTLKFSNDVSPIELIAVDVETMLKKNADPMFLIESEAIEFIRDTYTTYSRVNKVYDKVKANQEIDFERMATEVEKKTKTKMAVVKEDCDSFDIVPLDTANEEGKRVLLSTRIDRFIASFSGGKDSQVVLDLCTRAIPPTDFEVIYSDTGYELPSSIELYEQVKKHYSEKFPALKFSTTRNHESVLNYWDKIGTPSDTHRWCCTVMKTAPLYRSLKVEGNKQARVLTFDGVRAEESTKRNAYNRIGKAVKHATVINASPILGWNAVEIFLYLFKYNLFINPAYRFGDTRVGCVICPFSSEWNDMINNNRFKKSVLPFLSKVENNVSKLNIPDPIEYIKSGNWKRRAGGRDMKPDSSLIIKESKPDLIMEISNSHKNLTTWLHTIGDFKGNSTFGTIRVQDNIYTYKAEKTGSKITINFPGVSRNAILTGLLKRAIYKSTYCINCEACEVECPTGALTIIPEVKIDNKKCIKCHKCLNFHELGCIVAHSLKITTSKTTKMKLIGYNNFGLKEEWLDYFSSNYEDYFKSDDHGLNTKEQLPSFIKWLVHAEILEDVKNKKITELGKLLMNLYQEMPALVWEIIWINLSYNSPITEWYTQSVSFQRSLDVNELRAMIKNDYPETSETTVKNIVYALLRTLKESPIGEEMCQYISEGKNKFSRKPYIDISLEGLAYSLYKYGELHGTKELRVSSLLSDEEHGPKVEFGLERTLLLKLLRTLHLQGILTAELNMGLDHITLKPTLTTNSVLFKMTK